MMQEILVGFLIFVVAFSMTLVGKGGGNFYVVILLFVSISIYEASAAGQFILFCASFAGILVFQKTKAVNWALAIPVAVLIAMSAFAGGYLSFLFDETSLKMIFAFFLVVAGLVMILPYEQKQSGPTQESLGRITISTDSGPIGVDFRIVVPITVVSGFFSGMIGVSGGSFLVPMLVLGCGLPMRTGVTTATPLVATSALMGFFGHFFQGHFNPYLAMPLAVVTIIGGVLGGRYALKSKPRYLKQLFAVTNIIAALLVVVNLLIS